MLLFGCRKESAEPKSADCDILLFSVDALTWNIEGTAISRLYPSESSEGMLTPVISLSAGATVDPPSGEAQNFFAADGVRYTVTAADGVSTKVYVARATRTPFSGCEIVAFSAGGVEWFIDDDFISFVFPQETVEVPMTPIISLSAGATVVPAADVPQNFFVDGGVEYRVSSEDGATSKIYSVKARRISSDCNIVTFAVDGVAWQIFDTLVVGTYLSATTDTPLIPVIGLSTGATIDPPSNEAQYFFSEQGVRYTVTAEDGRSTKFYTVKATAADMLTKYVSTDWVALPRYGYRVWVPEGAGSQDLWVGGYPMLAIDDDPESAWHSVSFDQPAPFPQALIVDMKQSRQVARIAVSGNYFKNVMIYLTDDLAMPENFYYSLDVLWDDDDDNWRVFDYNFWMEQMMEMLPEVLPAPEWGSPVAQMAADSESSFSILLPQAGEGQFLILLFPDNSLPPNDQTFIVVSNVEVYHN
jgi:hypothetical protein